MRATSFQEIEDNLRQPYVSDGRPWLVGFSGGNHSQNGLALGESAHWMFDAGWWSLTGDCELIVATARFNKCGDAAYLLKRTESRMIHLTAKRDHWPEKVHSAWYRECRIKIGFPTGSAMDDSDSRMRQRRATESAKRELFN
jgi:hypothetical protein